MQKLIMEFTDSGFMEKVQDLLDEGWTVVHGTLMLINKRNSPTTRYIVVLESPEETDVNATSNYP